MRSRIAMIVMALVMGGLAAVLSASYLNSARLRLDSQAQPIEVLVAQENIPRGTSVDELFKSKLVTVQQIPRQFVAAGAISSQRAIDGQVLSAPLSSGEQLTSSRFQYPSQAGLAYSVPENYLAVSIPVDKVSSVSGLLRPGDQVAVMGTTQRVSGDPKSVATRVIIPRARVLAVGADSGAAEAQTAQPQQSGGLMSAAGRTQDTAINAVTLALSASDAEKVVFVANMGEGKGDRSLWVALLPVKTTSVPPTKGQTSTTVFGR